MSDRQVPHALPLLATLRPEHAALVLARTRRVAVGQGDVLVRQGDAADTLFLVVRGRFAVRAAGRTIAVIGAAEPVGEIAFFSGGRRSADVVALRNAEVLALTRADWEALTAEIPEIAQSVLSALARRLGESTRFAPPMRPAIPRCVALTGGVPDALRGPLVEELGRLSPWEVLAPDAADPRERMQRAEEAGRRVLLIDPDPALLGEVDAVYDVAPLGACPANGTPDRTILWRARTADPIVGTAAHLGAADMRHHHVALNCPGSIARLARFVDGSALGLVLSGGGAQGTAHLGAVKALSEAGIGFDMIGGTSAGAAMGAALAIGRHPDEVMDLCEEIFLKGRAMSRYTLPRFSVLDPTLFDAALRRHFGDRRIEDLERPFFAVATNLSTNDTALLQRGPLWEALRASTSIPVVFPPWIDAAGNVMVDGAVMDNAPILAMRDLKPGANLLLNMARAQAWHPSAAYGDLPGRAALAGQVLASLVRRREAAFPSLVAVLARVFNVNAQNRLRSIDAPGDIIIDIEPLEGMAFLDWSRARAQYDASYRRFAQALDRTSGADPIARLQAVAAQIRSVDGPSGDVRE